MASYENVILASGESFKAYWAIETSKIAVVERMKELGGDEFSENEYNELGRLMYLFTTIGQQMLSPDDRFYCKATERTGSSAKFFDCKRQRYPKHIRKVG